MPGETPSHAALGVVVLAPLALGAALAGAYLAASGAGLREGPAPPEPVGWITACFFLAGLLFLWWIACIVLVWRRVRRERIDAAKEPIPRATIVDRGEHH